MQVSYAVEPDTNEHKALLLATQIMFKQLSDPELKQLSKTQGPGCWLNSKERIAPNARTRFASQSVTCVAWDLGMGTTSGYLLVPTRIVKACARAKEPLPTCIE